MGQRVSYVLLSIAVAAVCVAAIVLWADLSPGDLAEALSKLGLGRVAASVLLLVAIQSARGARIRALLPAKHRPARFASSCATAAWILDAQVIPAKIGEGALILHLRRLGVPGSEAAMALVLSRIMDLATLLAAFGAVCAVLAFTGVPVPAMVLGGLAAGSVFGAACLLAAITRGSAAWSIVPRTLAALLGRTSRFSRAAVGFAERVGDAIGAVDAGKRGRAAVWSIAVWILVIGYYALLARGFGIDLTLAGLAFGASLAVVGGLVPVSGFLGFGFLDVGWVAGFVILGVERELAASSGLAFHLVYLAGLIVVGGVGHLMLMLRRPAPSAG